MDSIWDDAQIISSYSRAQAIADGVLVDVTDQARDWFRIPPPSPPPPTTTVSPGTRRTGLSRTSPGASPTC